MVGPCTGGLLPALLVLASGCSSTLSPGWGWLCLQGKQDGMCWGEGSQ